MPNILTKFFNNNNNNNNNNNDEPSSFGMERNNAAKTNNNDPSSSSSSDAPTPLSYSSAGGGEASFLLSPSSVFSSVFSFLYDEAQRPSRDPVLVQGPDLHQRLPVWMETKDVDILGNPLSEKELNDAAQWRGKYKKELEIADAIVHVKTQRIHELEHNVIGFTRNIRRWLGLAPPLSEAYAKEKAEEIWRQRVERQEEGENASATGSDGDGGAAAAAAVPSPSATLHKDGVLYESPSHSHSRSVGTAWNVLMTTATTGKPVAQVAAAYRPRLDFYGLDAFIDSPGSFMWFWTKIGMFIGLAQGTSRAAQAITTDVQYLRASGVGVLSVLNLSVLAGVVKWGGNAALLSGTFCLGDALVTSCRQIIVPAHEWGGPQPRRTTLNYVAGLGLAGSTVGVMPWWVLNDFTMALRLSASGVCVGCTLGCFVGLVLQRMIALNISRLDATPRHMRRYEALLLRQREWAEEETRRAQKSAVVWW